MTSSRRENSCYRATARGEPGTLKSADASPWAGYLYRYWHYLTGESSAEIYPQAPLEVMLDVFPGMHALSPEMAVGDLKELSR